MYIFICFHLPSHTSQLLLPHIPLDIKDIQCDGNDMFVLHAESNIVRWVSFVQASAAVSILCERNVIPSAASLLLRYITQLDTSLLAANISKSTFCDLVECARRLADSEVTAYTFL